ncbi:hypothetical protein [Microbulbifer celer]|uniref:Tetratricopeptide repeat protein n=1 Tax=Microbulbifer celer TaxID=435905 RepID=A0ABW3UBW6_9GAMM|nr:hypothetical protein [Microbulbifer celer]UFN55948.1 hypothetical protein LPW13_10190 [Microbulbifer celer]
MAQTQMNNRCDRVFKQEVLRKCYEALMAVGFTRYRKEAVDWPLEDGFHCWVGLNEALYDEYFEINPFVGIHVVPLEKLWSVLKERKYDRGVATYALHMGLLSPHEPVFHFTRQTDIEAEAERLAKLYLDVGLSYAKSIASYEALLPLLQDRVDMLGAYPERVASCLYLMGRREEARQFTEDFLEKERNYFERFAVPFLEKLATEEAGRTR